MPGTSGSSPAPGSIPPPRPDGESRPPSIAPRSHKVLLVVDDDAITRSAIRREFERDYEVYEAADGLAAAELCATIPPPSLVICDVTMPRLDGFGLAKIFKSNPILKLAPIVFLTGRASAMDVTRGIQAGARHYIIKPFAMTDLRAKVTKILG